MPNPGVVMNSGLVKERIRTACLAALVQGLNVAKDDYIAVAHVWPRTVIDLHGNRSRNIDNKTLDNPHMRDSAFVRVDLGQPGPTYIGYFGNLSEHAIYEEHDRIYHTGHHQVETALVESFRELAVILQHAWGGTL